MKAPIRRFAGVAVAATALLVVALVSPDHGAAATYSVLRSFREMLVVLPPVFVFLGLLDEWIPRETLIRHMGSGAGARGTLLAFLMGSVAAGPLYAAFPVATVLLRKGSSSFNVMVFIGAWSTTKVPMFLFEYAAMGGPFALTRLAANIPAILLIALIVSRSVPVSSPPDSAPVRP